MQMTSNTIVVMRDVMQMCFVGFSIDFPIKTQWNAVYVTSRLGCLGRPAGANSPLLLYENMAYVQTAAASSELP